MVYRDVHFLCPRCGIALESHTVMGNQFLRCQQCRGAFVDPATLSRMVVDMGGVPAATYPVDAERKLGCPHCATPMVRSRIQTLDGPIEIDICAQHGIWFDTRELQLSLEAVGLAGLEQRRG